MERSGYAWCEPHAVAGDVWGRPASMENAPVLGSVVDTIDISVDAHRMLETMGRI